MTKKEKTKKIPFTKDDILNRDLIIKMLKYEDEIGKSEIGQSMYRNELNDSFTSLTVEKALNRMTLSHFGFDTTDDSLYNYRSIFLMYYRSPHEYDKEVIDSVYYMRENKCVFYKSDKLNIGDKIPDCPLFEMDGKTKTTLYDVILNSPTEKTMFASFSLS